VTKLHDAFTTAVTEFMDVMEQYYPGPYIALVEEEAKELVEAWTALTQSRTTWIPISLMANVIKELTDFHYVLFGLMVRQDRAVAEGGLPVSADALLKVAGITAALEPILDIINVMVPEAQQIEALKEVQRSNMSKLGLDGRPVFNDAGKIVKGINYSPADLTDLARRVINSHGEM
jgi:hypothetical protein